MLGQDLFLFAVDGVWSSFLLLRVIRAWSNRVKREAKLETSEKNVARTFERKQQAQTFHRWRKNASQQKNLRAFTALRRKREKGQLKEFLRSCFLTGLKQYAIQKRKLFEASCVLKGLHRARVLQEEFRSWKSFTLACRFREHRKVLNAVRSWYAFQQREAAISVLKIKAYQFAQRAKLRFVFRDCWRAAVRSSQTTRNEQEKILELRALRNLLQRSWQAWHSARDRIYLRWVRPRRQYVRKLLCKVLFLLKLRVLRRQQLRELTDQLAESVSLRKKQRTVPIWFAAARKKRDWRTSTELKLNAFTRNTRFPGLQKRSFFLWRHRVTRRKQFEASLDQHELDFILRPFFLRWQRDYTVLHARPETKIQNDTARKFFRKKFLGEFILKCWRKQTITEKQNAEHLRTALTFWYLNSMGKTVRCWRSSVGKRKEKRSREELAMAQFRTAQRRNTVRELLKFVLLEEEREENELRQKFEADWAHKEKLARPVADRFLQLLHVGAATKKSRNHSAAYTDVSNDEPRSSRTEDLLQHVGGPTLRKEIGFAHATARSPCPTGAHVLKEPSCNYYKKESEATHMMRTEHKKTEDRCPSDMDIDGVQLLEVRDSSNNVNYRYAIATAQ
ncbi:unnamed protein product [Amoebophrya sp. A120]|nr:unnamed protein product [Amoebophrya sp. A120]|eukprot:GSA120T00018795001.1